MKLKVSNLNKPSHTEAKKIADIALYTLPLYLTTVMTLPIEENVKMWINFAISTVVVTLKAISKFTTNE